MDTEELLDWAMTEATTRVLFEEFCLRDLFPAREWGKLSPADRAALGKRFSDPTTNPLLGNGDLMLLDEKTEDGQWQYSYVGRFKNGATIGTIITDDGEEIEVVIAADELEEGAVYETETCYANPEDGRYLFVMKRGSGEGQHEGPSLPVTFEEGVCFDVRAFLLYGDTENDAEDNHVLLQIRS